MHKPRNTTTTLRKGGPRAFWKRRRDESGDGDDDDVMTPKKMKARDDHQRDEMDSADNRTTIGDDMARTEALDQPLPGSESDHSLSETNPRAQLSLSTFQEVVSCPPNDLAVSDNDVQSERGVINPDNPIVSLVKLDELEMLINNMSIN